MRTAIIQYPTQAVIDGAHRWTEEREDPPGSNRGVMIDFANYYSIGAQKKFWKPFRRGVKGAPWCAAWLTLVGRLTLGKAWPIPDTVSCQALFEWASTQALVYKTPQIGDLFLLWYPKLSGGRYGHVGLVIGCDHFQSMSTLEGNTGAKGEREGWGVFEKRRRVEEDTRFVRWAKALPDISSEVLLL